ncbi:Glycosyltransferase involved in cell wall bisynthesis [Dethiosulfatibacter aminovorans DSM 17477]|uniref:Glycosyltransferase involved in cell wall bisynthesis n=1 Tax=Dethiosulfatibacter aminovorans DSM 17477 TaxID=1121476 RepID=A0A1M6M6Z3_9FIRM|nr:glycosyltransferase [Dethiosulfatibacter aminovorans]SHJ79232.1 Glycosyltransferase involved in cell wall bisynthesis [Dethiosulfatibacter aminovorans DSM 17477]
MKILEFIGSLSDGGAETLVKDYATLINKECFKIEVAVIWDNGKSANSKLLREVGTTIHKMYPIWNFPIRVINKTIGRFYVSRRIINIVKKNRIGCIHVHLSQLKYISPISKQLRNLNVQVLYTCHNIPVKFFGGVNNIEKKAANTLIQNNHMQIIALHSDMAKELNEMFGVTNTVVVHNGIDFNRFTNCKISYEQAKSRLKIPRDKCVIGHVGRFNIQKNHDKLVDIFLEYKKRNKNAFLLLVGDGSLRERVENKLNQFVTKDNYLILSHRTDIPQIMKAMDCFVFPSLYEGLGIVLIEAQAVGIKCIVSDSVPSDAFISDGIYSLSLDETDEKWCDVIQANLERRKLICDFKHYDMNNEIRVLERIYNGF